MVENSNRFFFEQITQQNTMIYYLEHVSKSHFHPTRSLVADERVRQVQECFIGALQPLIHHL
jgi:hypothetical protein